MEIKPLPKAWKRWLGESTLDHYSRYEKTVYLSCGEEDVVEVLIHAVMHDILYFLGVPNDNFEHHKIMKAMGLSKKFFMPTKAYWEGKELKLE